MNKIVDKWKHWEAREKYEGPEGLKLDGEVRHFQQEKKSMGEISKIGFNRYSLVELALFGPQERKECVFRETRRAVERLGLDLSKVKPFTELPRGDGPSPNLQDIIRWLNAIETEGTLYAKDRKFLGRLHVTLSGRVRPKVLKED